MRRSGLLFPDSLFVRTGARRGRAPGQTSALRTRARLFGAVLAAGLLFSAAPSRADVAVEKGVKEVGLESIFVTTYSNTQNTSAFQLTFFGGATFRYFVIDNLGLSITAGGLYDTSDRAGGQSDFAGFGTLNASYYFLLGRGMHIAPMLGAGGFYGGRTEGEEPNRLRSSLVGGIARGGLGLVFYPTERMNLFARPEAIALFGSAKPESTVANPEPEGTGFVRVSGGFSVGMNLVF